MKLHFIGGTVSDCKVEKEGRKWLYFRAVSTSIKYRVDKETGIVQVSPYWNTIRGMFVEQEAQK